MAKLRKWCAYKKTVERPYTRFSKYRKKAFVKARPGKKVIKFDMGDIQNGTEQFPMVLKLTSKDNTLLMVRTNAIEAARITALRRLEGKLGRSGFYFRIKMHPHHAIRENPLAAGAGADRLSTGMKHSFGKIIGMAARVEPNSTLMEIHVPIEYEAIARDALKGGAKKLPIRCRIETLTHAVKELTEEQILVNQLNEAKFAVKEATEELEKANKSLAVAESEEDKKKAEADIENAKAKIESCEHIVKLEEEHIHEVEEEHSLEK